LQSNFLAELEANVTFIPPSPLHHLIFSLVSVSSFFELFSFLFFLSFLSFLSFFSFFDFFSFLSFFSFFFFTSSPLGSLFLFLSLGGDPVSASSSS